MGKISKLSRDLDLDPTKPNVEPIPGLFISYSIFKFSSYRAYTQTDRQTDNGDEYSIPAVTKLAVNSVI